jgi:uncharacterized protein (DUF1778 family)
MTKPRLTEMVSVVFTPEQLKAITAAAEAADRKVASFIRNVVVQHLEKEGKIAASTEQDVDEDVE